MKTWKTEEKSLKKNNVFKSIHTAAKFNMMPTKNSKQTLALARYRSLVTLIKYEDKSLIEVVCSKVGCERELKARTDHSVEFYLEREQRNETRV